MIDLLKTIILCILYLFALICIIFLLKHYRFYFLECYFGGDILAEITRKVEEDGVNYVSYIPCKTISGVHHNQLLTIVSVKAPTLIFIGTMCGLYSVKIEDIANIAKTALEEANKGV